MFLAVHLQKYKRVPVIGKVKSVLGDNFEIECWKGSWCKEWTPLDVQWKGVVQHFTQNVYPSGGFFPRQEQQATM